MDLRSRGRARARQRSSQAGRRRHCEAPTQGRRLSYYSKITSRFWTGDTGRALRGDLAAQVVASYLITCAHANMLGFYALPVAYISTDTGIPIEGASKALQRLCDEGFCKY